MERGDIDPDAEQGLIMVLRRRGWIPGRTHRGRTLPEYKESAGKKMSSRIQKGKNDSFLVRIQI